MNGISFGEQVHHHSMPYSLENATSVAFIVAYLIAEVVGLCSAELFTTSSGSSSNPLDESTEQMDDDGSQLSQFL